MSLKLGDELPNFDIDTTIGKMKLHEYFGNSWGILFSHPADYTPVCTTELARAAALAPEFAKRGVKMIALSCDDTASHMGWAKDVMNYSANKFNTADGELPYPIIADPGRKIALACGMLDPEELDSKKMAVTCRAVFIVDESKKVKLSILYPATTGRSFDEILRVIDSLQLTVNQKVATPVDWSSGKECMVLPTLSDDAAKGLFPKGFNKVDVPSKKGYLRFTPDPR